MIKKHLFKKGFTVIELLVVLFIIATIVAIGMMHYRNQLEYREFQTKFDNLVQQVRQAQQEARAYGEIPSGYKNSGSCNNAKLRNFRVFLLNSGLSSPPSVNQYNNVQLVFNFKIPPMSESDLKKKYKGVALAFGYEEPKKPAQHKFDMMLPFGPNGAPYVPPGAYDIPTDEFVIQMNMQDTNGNVKKSRAIFIHRDTAVVRTEIIKP